MKQTEQQLQEVYALLESRGIPINEIVKVLQEVQSSHTKLSSEAAEAAIKKVLANPRVQEALFMGLELDRLTEEGKISEPLRTIIESDEPLFGIDETLALVPIFEQGLEAFLELGHRDNHKIGIIKRLDSKKDRVNTFADDLIATITTMADADLIKDKQIYVEKDLANARPVPPTARMPLSDLNKMVKSRARTDEVRKAAMQRLEDRGLTIDKIADEVFAIQKKYNPMLTPKATKQQVKEVLGLGRKELKHNPHAREIYHAILVLTELEELANRGELSKPMMRRLQENRTKYQSSLGVALFGSALNGSIAITRNGYATQHPYQSLPQPTTEGPFSMFTADIGRMLVGNVMGRTAHTQRETEESRFRRMQYGAGNVMHSAKTKGRKILLNGRTASKAFSSVITRKKAKQHEDRVHSSES